MTAVLAAWVAIMASGVCVAVCWAMAFERWVRIGAWICVVIWIALVVVAAVKLGVPWHVMAGVR
jgi:hypothetical protein